MGWPNPIWTSGSVCQRMNTQCNRACGRGRLGRLPGRALPPRRTRGTTLAVTDNPSGTSGAGGGLCSSSPAPGRRVQNTEESSAVSGVGLPTTLMSDDDRAAQYPMSMGATGERTPPKLGRIPSAMVEAAGSTGSHADCSRGCAGGRDCIDDRRHPRAARSDSAAPRQVIPTCWTLPCLGTLARIFRDLGGW